MIRPLRQRHRRTVVALGIFLPVAFAVGIALRNPVPIMARLPGNLAPSSPHIEALIWERAGLFAKTPVLIRLCREQKDAGLFAIGLTAPGNFIKPDLLVYWAAAGTSLADALPANAILLGAFGTTALPLPDEAMNGGGSLILYSLADNEIVDVSKPIRPGEPTR
jgi:hypothetical protein